MSNRNAGEIPAHRKSKVSLAMIIIQGLGGPKANPKGAADGQPVNIPAPEHIILRRGRSLVVWVNYWIFIAYLRIFKSKQNILVRQNKLK